MSIPYVLNNEIVPSSAYLLSEAIRPSSIFYGILPECNNFQIMNYKDNLYYTFMKTEQYYYMIGVWNKGDVFFSVSTELPANMEVKYLLQHFKMHRFQTRNILLVFGNIWYIARDIINIFNINRFRFEADNVALGKAYSKIVTNKYFLESMKEDGFERMEDEEGYYIFERNK